MSEDRGDEISAKTKEFLLYQNAMAELGSTDKLIPNWWNLVRYGLQAVEANDGKAWTWLGIFDYWAKTGDPMAIALLTKVMELRLRG